MPSFVEFVTKKYLKPPVLGNFPPKPGDYWSIYIILEAGKIPSDNTHIALFAMPSDPSKGYYYADMSSCRQMTPEEQLKWEEIKSERASKKRAGSKTVSGSSVLPDPTQNTVLRQAKKDQGKEQKDPKEKRDILGYKSKIHLPVFDELKGKNIICFDTETTGVTDTDEILQMTIVSGNLLIGKEAFVEVLYSAYFKPRFHEEWTGAMMVNHISPEMVKDKPYITSCVNDFKELFDEADYIVGYNVAFDIRLLKQCLGNEINIPEEKVMDMMDYFKETVPEGKHKLIDAVTRYCPERLEWFEKNAHDASADAVATVYVFEGQKNQYLSKSNESSEPDKEDYSDR